MVVVANRARCLAIGLVAIAMMLFAFGIPATALAAGDDGLTPAGLQAETDQADYDFDAVRYGDEEQHQAFPGVFTTTVTANVEGSTMVPTIGIPSIADVNLTTPTLESPAIICGTAVPNKDEENARQFTPPSLNRVAPYSYFKYSVLQQQGQDGTTLPKLSGFDGTYVIVRINVSDLLKKKNGTPLTTEDTGYYLHVSQEKNNALLVAVGMDTVSGNPDRDQWGNCSFSNLYTPPTADGQTAAQYQRKTASYNLSEMLDTTGIDPSTPYFDVILFSTASIVAGADQNKPDVPKGDVDLSFYVDQTADYNKEINWDPQSTDTTLPAKCFAKFFDEEKANEYGAKISRYTVKGSDLALETMVEKSDATGEKTTYWSLAKSMQDPYYDQAIDESATDPGCGRTITLMSEVPVIDNMELIGESETKLKKRTLDVNSFDIQIANNTSEAEGQYTSGLAVKNAWLTLSDLSRTTGAELAVGNNATFTIDTGGKLIVDETCQLEVEWDGATTAPASGEQAEPASGSQTTPAADILNNGALDLLPGGQLQNDGVITIEGTEGKPYQPDAGSAATESAKGHGEMTIREGATLVNNGCFMPNGALYVQGTLVNNGRFDDNPIVSNDPDKGQFTYHRGIQVTWKDDVTQSNIIYGGIYVGMDKTWQNTYAKAVLENNGDIVLCPGELVNYATVRNGADGRILSCATDKAVIPIEPTPEAPTVITKEVTFDEPHGSFIYNWGTMENHGVIRPAQVTIATSGSLGQIVIPGNYDDLFVFDMLGDGKISGMGFMYKHDLASANVELRRKTEVLDSVVYNGAAQMFDIVIFMGGRAYADLGDFKVSYFDPSGAAIEPNQVVNAGTYRIVVKGKETFKGQATKFFSVKKAANTMTAAGKAAKLKRSKVKKKAQVIKRAKALTVTNAVGGVTYSLAGVTKAKFKKYFKVNPKTGNIKVKKGLKKGTYTVKVGVTASGNQNYSPLTKVVAVKVKVK